jgi:hypothetical protein
VQVSIDALKELSQEESGGNKIFIYSQSKNCYLLCYVAVYKRSLEGVDLAVLEHFLYRHDTECCYFLI